MDGYRDDAPPQVHVPVGDPLDDLSASSLTIGRLRRFLTDPLSPAEEAEGQHRADDIVERMCGRP